MKNLFLYQTISKDKLPLDSGVYHFNNTDLIGIDVDQIDKNNRKKLVSNLKLRDFFVIQPWFWYLIKNSKDLGITITNIRFNRELQEELFFEMKTFILQKNIEGLIIFLEEVSKDDYDIESISFYVGKYQFTITENGLLETYIDDDQFIKVLGNSSIWNALKGSRY